MRAPVPALARWLLRACAPPEQRDWLAGDLDEEAAARAAAHGTRRARWWSWGQVLRSVVPLVARRVETGMHAIRSMQMTMWRGVRSDVQVAWRRLLAAPGFAAVCIVTLALGIGGNTAVFTLIDQVLLKPLPVARPTELYRLGGGDNCCVNTGLQRAFSLFSYDLYRHLREAAPEFSNLAAFQANTGSITTGRADGSIPPETLIGSFVSGNYFQTFGLLPAAGRLLVPDDDRPGAAPVAVISYPAWRDRFQASPSVIGAAVTLNGVTATVVGVAPPGFFGETLRPNATEIWVPLADEPLLQPQARLLEQPASHWLYVIGRLPPGTTVAPVNARLTASLQQWIRGTLDLAEEDRLRIPEQSIEVVPAAGGVRSMRDEVAPSLRLLQVIAAAVLLIACANLANLLLARSVGRRTETAVRIALGAPRSRLVVQCLVESLLLAVLGGWAGMLVAYAGARAIIDMTFRGATGVPLDAAPSPLVLLFAIAVSMLTGLLFGVGPALFSSRSNPVDAMRGAGRTTADRGSWIRRTLVAVQVALSLVLLTGAGLLARSLAGLQAQDFGFCIEQRYVVDIVPTFGAAPAAELESAYARIVAGVREIPGVAGAAMSLYAPMSGDNWSGRITVEGHDTTERLSASWNRVTPAYFETIGTPLLRGRVLTERDRPGASMVAVVNETFARRFFGDADPIGRHFGRANRDGSGAREFEIVGVVGDAKYQDAKGPAYATFFLPFLQTSEASALGGADASGLDRSHFPRALEVQTAATVPNLEAELRRMLARVDRRVTVRGVSPMAEQVARNFNVERLIATLATAFGGVALLLACLGLYGVTAYGVSRRTREIGIRMAIGATQSGVLRSVLRSAFGQLALGVAIGIPASLAAGSLLRANLFGVTAHDPLTLACAVAILTLCALVAALIPARRAASVDPMRALRTE